MATEQIKFRPGQMDRFISTKSFTLGGTNYSVYDGMEILFDGTNVELNGTRFVLPTLRGAIRMGWLVRAEDYNPDAGPVANPSANIGVRPANDLGNNPLSPPKKNAVTTIESDERVVMSRSDRTQAAAQRTNEVRASQGRQAPGAFVARGSGMDIIGGSEFGVEVERRFQTPAKAGQQITPNNVGTAIRDAELVKIQPGEGISEDDLVSRMTQGERATYYAEKEARAADVVTRTPGYVPPPAVTTNLASMNQPGMQRQASQAQRAQVQIPEGPQVVGRVAPRANETREGITVGVTTGGGIETYDASGTNQRPQESVVEAEGMTFRNTNGPKKAMPGITMVNQNPPAQAPQSSQLPGDNEGRSSIERDGTAAGRRQIAKAICKDFPDDYSFYDHWKRRIAMIRLNYETRYDIIRAIFAAESDVFKKIILEEFPEAFQS